MNIAQPPISSETFETAPANSAIAPLLIDARSAAASWIAQAKIPSAARNLPSGASSGVISDGQVGKSLQLDANRRYVCDAGRSPVTQAFNPMTQIAAETRQRDVDDARDASAG